MHSFYLPKQWVCVSGTKWTVAGFANHDVECAQTSALCPGQDSSDPIWDGTEVVHVYHESQNLSIRKFHFSEVITVGLCVFPDCLLCILKNRYLKNKRYYIRIILQRAFCQYHSHLSMTVSIRWFPFFTITANMETNEVLFKKLKYNSRTVWKHVAGFGLLFHYRFLHLCL